jgi:putative oxidoreductase
MPRAQHGSRARSCDKQSGKRQGTQKVTQKAAQWGEAMSFADKFNLLNEFNLLRIICALFFIPHIVAKFTVPAALKFYVDVGFKPPKFWMYLAGAIETVLTIGLLFDIYTPYVAFIAFIHLLVAGAATYKLTKSWIWVIGGIEYCIFWAICCLVVAMHAYHTVGL